MDSRDDLGAPDTRFGAVLSAVAVLSAMCVIVPFFTFGTLSAHMLVHIATMNILAPLLAVALSWRVSHGAVALWSATILQLALLWAAHSPHVHHAMHGSVPVLVALHAALFVAAVLFWGALVNPCSSRVQSVLALLVSGKLACLLGVLLIFSPRVMFASGHAAHAPPSPVEAAAALADQQLAGLLMIAACPLSYVLAAVVITAQSVIGLESSEAAETAPQTAGRRMPA